MKRFLYLLSVLYLSIGIVYAQKKPVKKPVAGQSYLNNRTPLRPNPYIELPIGAITAEGWLKEMLLRQRNGATGKLDELYPTVMNNRNGWLGGDGDQWERGPYWLDGLLPLAYLLKDEELIAKTKPWIEWAIKSQQADGYFGPSKDYPYEKGIQRDNSRDWWPKMVMLKVLKQYYSATGDQRVIELMRNYFRYQLKELPAKPLDHWTFWARYRAGDNLAVVYWLYNITGDDFLLQLADLIHKQTFDFTGEFLNGELLSKPGSIHCVNLAQGFKEPLIYFQQHPEEKYADAIKKGFEDLRKYNGMAHGLYGGDEALHGNDPTQGSELCSAVEMMFSLESMLPITGDVSFADKLEKIAFNALPTQVSDDFMSRQYFQQANQVLINRQTRNFDVNHGGTDVCYGLLTGYPCCTSNMHQGWPKFTQNLWYASADTGLAAFVYAPSEVTAFVSNGSQVKIKEETNYPFEETIRFSISLDKRQGAVNFPFHLRVPQWCKGAVVTINGQSYAAQQKDGIIKIKRDWKTGDVVTLQLPMTVSKQYWHENSVSIERGPITYALKIGEDWKKVNNELDPVEYGETYYEVHPTGPWNYGLPAMNQRALDSLVIVRNPNTNTNFPWNLENAPIEIRIRARKIPSWKLYNGMTGPIPYSITYGLETEKEEEIVLIPYGCTTLRVSQFPELGRN